MAAHRCPCLRRRAPALPLPRERATMRRIAALVALLALSTTVGAAERSKGTLTAVAVADAARTSIYIGHTGVDAAGVAFVNGIREGIRASNRFRLAASEREANVVLVVVSVSPASTGNAAAAVSLAYVANNEWRSLLGSAARFVGRDRAAAMGRESVRELSAVLAAYDPTAVQ